MSFAFMPFFTGDYYRDTRHLSMLQHGAYRLLLDHCWDQQGPLPLDLERCYRICGAASKEEQDAVRSIVAEFFVAMEDGHYNRRMQREIERSAAISDKRSKAGKQGGLTRAKHLPSKRQAKARQMSLTPTTTTTLTPTTTTTGGSAAADESATGTRGTRLPKPFNAPDTWITWAAKNTPSVDVAHALATFVDYWHSVSGSKGTKLDWFATWRNWCRKDEKDAAQRSPKRSVDALVKRSMQAAQAGIFGDEKSQPRRNRDDDE